MRWLLVLVVVGCGGRASLPIDEVDEAGVVRCPSTKLEGANCSTSLSICTYISTTDLCGTSTCTCGRRNDLACGVTPGCTPGLDHRTWCHAGASCTARTGCVIESCGRNCLCVDGKFDCPADRCG